MVESDLGLVEELRMLGADRLHLDGNLLRTSPLIQPLGGTRSVCEEATRLASGDMRGKKYFSEGSRA